jgi:hypothetical protein
MPDQLNLPTTLDEFIDFLNGDPVDPYGNMGTIVLDALQDAIQRALYDGLKSALLQKEPGCPIDIFSFMRVKVFFMLANPLESILRDRLDVNRANVGIIIDACFSLVSSFVQCRLIPPSKGTPDPVSEPPGLRMVKDLLADCDNGNAPTQEDDIRIVRISEYLVISMSNYLLDLKNEDELAQRAKQSLIFTPVSGKDMQDGRDGGLFDLGDWQRAWNKPFQGNALAALETTLQLHAHAIRSDHNKKLQMSRVIPVVQASGTGKSRLAEE